MRLRPLHPATLLSGWLAAVVGSQLVTGNALLLALLVSPLLVRRAARQWWNLLCAARWLLLSLFVILSWGTAGEAAWPFSGAPTLDGIEMALTQLCRLSFVLLAVAALREYVPTTDLLAGARRLLAPLRHCGVEVDRGVVRLLLVLHYCEQTPRPRDWRTLLATPAGSAIEVIELADRPPRWYDYVLQGTAAGLLAALAVVAASV